MDVQTNWALCAICQESDTIGLRCPADSKRPDKGAGYVFLAESINQFTELGCVPKGLCVSRLDDGDGIEATLSKNRARWHKSCYDLFSSTRLKRAQKRKADSQLGNQEKESAENGRKFTRSNATAYTMETTACLICGDDKEPQHLVSTFAVDKRIRECAITVNDQTLLAKLGCGKDLVALETRYHVKCLTDLYRTVENPKKEQFSDNESSGQLEGIALAELVWFIEESRSGGQTTFRLADLANMYKSNLSQLGVEVLTRVNTSRVKERILSHVPDLEAYNKGRDVYLAFRGNIGDAIGNLHHRNPDNDAMHLAKTAALIRKDILGSKYSFNRLKETVS